MQDVANGNAIIQTLRTARNATGALAELRAASHEARRDRIAEALQDPGWAAGPAELLYTYPHHVVASKDGMVMRVGVEETDGKIELGKVEVFQISESVANVGEEVMETARAAVGRILDEDYAEATPMVASIANALSYGGDLRRQIQTEIAKRSIVREAWWHKVIREHMGDDANVTVPSPVENDLAASFTDLKEALADGARECASAIQKLGEDDVDEAIQDAARDIAEDFKYAIQALDGANRNNEAEMAGVYESVHQMAAHLLLGARFLSGLAESVNPETESETEE